jgi:hypothetical protein
MELLLLCWQRIRAAGAAHCGVPVVVVVVVLVSVVVALVLAWEQAAWEVCKLPGIGSAQLVLVLVVCQ